jgi:hypothetical protein
VCRAAALAVFRQASSVEETAAALGEQQFGECPVFCRLARGTAPYMVGMRGHKGMAAEVYACEVNPLDSASVVITVSLLLAVTASLSVWTKWTAA